MSVFFRQSMGTYAGMKRIWLIKPESNPPIPTGPDHIYENLRAAGYPSESVIFNAVFRPAIDSRKRNESNETPDSFPKNPLSHLRDKISADHFSCESLYIIMANLFCF
jgi:hypothetical protein